VTEPAGRAPETAQTLDRGLQILQLLASPSGHGGMTISHLADHLGVGRAVVYRLVATLVARDFASRGPDGRVRLGIAGARLSVAVRPMLVEAARPVLRQLADEAGATAHLTIAEGNEALALLVVEPSWTDFHVAYRVGSRHPLTRGAAGRALLAGREGKAGVVVTEGELQSGAYGVAAPVLDVPGLEASLGLVSMGPLAGSVGELVLAAGSRLARALGATRSRPTT
jgi:DNA-binding IclR family transcriptional regulator